MHEEDTDEVGPKITSFLLHRPWYAHTKHETDADGDTEAGADPNVEGAGPERSSRVGIETQQAARSSRFLVA